MNKILYKSSPRLFILGVTGFGSIFCGLLSWLTWVNFNGKWRYIILILLILFSIFSLASFYLFITIKTVKLSSDSIRFSFLFLPFHHTYLLSDVKRISRESKDIKAYHGFSSSFRFNYSTTVFELSDNKTIKVNSIGLLDYEELVKCFNKITRGNGQYTPPKRKFLHYILDNLDGIGVVVLLIILTVGLAWSLIHR
jgi:hypothetical protein